MRLYLYLHLIAAIFVLAGATPTLACDCPAPDDKESFSRYPLVFTAKAEKTVAHVGDKYIETTVLTPEKFYKGSHTPNGQMMPLPAKSDCDFSYQEGKRYLIFGELTAENAIYLKSSICSPTREIAADFEPAPETLVPDDMLAMEIKVEESDLVCEGDPDCMHIQTECGCQCPVPINTVNGALYRSVNQALCARKERPMCDLYCPGNVHCYQKRCTWMDLKQQ